MSPDAGSQVQVLSVPPAQNEGPGSVECLEYCEFGMDRLLADWIRERGGVSEHRSWVPGSYKMAHQQDIASELRKQVRGLLQLHCSCWLLVSLVPILWETGERRSA